MKGEFVSFRSTYNRFNVSTHSCRQIASAHARTKRDASGSCTACCGKGGGTIAKGEGTSGWWS